MLVQLGFEEALLTSAGVHVNALAGDLILASPHYQYLLQPGSFPQGRLYQAGGDARVQSIAPIYLTGLPWTNPETRQHRMILVMGAEPRRGVFSNPEIDSQMTKLRDPEAALYDALGRTEYGPIADRIRRGRPVDTEIANRHVSVAGLINIGTTFGVDGTVIVSDQAFSRMLPSAGVSLGLIRLQGGADVEQARRALSARLPPDVTVYTREGFVRREQEYWSTNTPIGFIFKLGVSMGLFVGLIVVYQILYADVMEHLTEYATLKAIGYTDFYLATVVLQQGLLLSAFGFVPGALLTLLVYKFAAAATFLPLGMTLLRLAGVYSLTAVFCLIAAALAIRPLRTADPADIL
jgi:putative ABC transport system permease protein